MGVISQFANKAEFFRHLHDNRGLLIAEKRAATKCADAVAFPGVASRPAGALKDAGAAGAAGDVLDVVAVINTTGVLDSAGDVHIPGLWKKTLKERRALYLLQEHCHHFDHVISDEVEAATRRKAWRSLGVDADGDTEALIFKARVHYDRNSFMFEQYRRGFVKNHSVGMQYVKILLCINSDDEYLAEERENWNKFIGEVVNREAAEEAGYFWAVTEARLIEGSAVLLGANAITPTLSVKDIGAAEPAAATPAGEPAQMPLAHTLCDSLGRKLVNRKI